MHGLGDTGHGFYYLFDALKKQIPHFKIVLPTAHSIPVTANYGANMPAWFNFSTFDIKGEESEISDISDSVARISKLIDEEAKILNGSYNRIFLGGFS